MNRGAGRVVLASGGTAGHVYPAIAIAGELRERGEEPMFILPGPEFRDVVAHAGFQSVELPAGPWQLQGTRGRVRSVMRTAFSTLRAAAVFPCPQPGVVLGFGSYGSIAPILAAWARRIPAAILEPNAFGGLANRILHRFADRVYVGPFTAFPEVRSDKMVRAGMPVRREIEQIERSSDPRAALRILVFGDSGRSRFLDREMPAVLRRIAGHLPIRVVHLTERETIALVRERYEDVDVQVQDPSLAIAELYAETDLVISRSGASTLGELSAMGMPALLVPLATASEAHQQENAEAFRRAGAALVRLEDGWVPDEVSGALLALLSSEEDLAEMGAAARDLGSRSGASTIAEDLLVLRERS